MRIIGYIEHPTYVITVFQMGDKYSIKFENNLLEQTFKYRSGPHLSNIAQIRELVDENFLKQVDHTFQSMNQTRLQSLAKTTQEANDEFDEII